MPWHVYLLRLQNGCIYVGSTNDLERRLNEHRSGSGSKMTSESPTVELLYFESFPDRVCALKRERQLKRWSRAKKLALATCRLLNANPGSAPQVLYQRKLEEFKPEGVTSKLQIGTDTTPHT